MVRNVLILVNVFGVTQRGVHGGFSDNVWDFSTPHLQFSDINWVSNNSI